MSGRSGSTPLVTRGTATFALSGPQAELLGEALRMGGFLHVGGTRLRSARALVSLGLAKLCDDGRLGPGGNADGERWTLQVLEGVVL